jgi:3-(3-hydroxy-phenyl)propionate hydroxylase
MTTSSRLAQRRDQLIGAALATAEGREYFEHMRYRPVYRFTNGLVAGTPDVGVLIGQPRAYDTQSQSIRMMDEILGPGWALVGVDLADEDCWHDAEQIGAMLDAVSAGVPTGQTLPRLGRRMLVDVDGGLAREFGPYRGRFVLLRPDHFIAAAWYPDETPDVAGLVADWTRGSLRCTATN